jgi:hypothetical protein
MILRFLGGKKAIIASGISPCQHSPGRYNGRNFF